MANYIIIAVLAVIIFLMIRSLVRSHRKGQCSGGCAGCSGCAACTGCGSSAAPKTAESQSAEQ